MTPEFDDVLLTAYLDDEVTEAERKKVEEQLRTSAASRKLLEELRSVRNLVTQIHMTQSTRSYQQGPWNQANSVSHEESSPASEMSQVVLHDPRSRWKLPFQRLASIAALIAIAVCGRILLWQPNKPAISLSDGTRTSTDLDLKSRREIRPTHETEDFGISDKAVPASGSGGVRSLNESANRDKSESDVALSVSQATDGERFGNAPMQPSPKFQELNGIGDQKSKSQFSENKTTEPAPGAMNSNLPLDSHSLALNLTDPEVQKPFSEQTQHYFLDDLLKDQSQEWRKLDVHEVESLAGRSSDWVENSAKLKKSDSSERNEPIASLFFRYRNVNQLGRVIEDSTALLRKSATTKESESAEFDKKPAEKQKKVAERPLLVEFEIPSDDWASGAKRLRQLGISVPLELPDVEYLEFTGVAISSVAKTGASASVSELSLNRPDRDYRVAGSQELSRWTFQPIDPLQGRRSVEQLAEKEATLSKNDASVMERPNTIRIRVRAITTKEK